MFLHEFQNTWHNSESKPLPPFHSHNNQNTSIMSLFTYDVTLKTKLNKQNKRPAVHILQVGWMIEIIITLWCTYIVCVLFLLLITIHISDNIKLELF